MGHWGGRGCGKYHPPPIISSIASSTNTTSATITWSTNESASSTVNYGLTSSYGTASTSASLITSHSIILNGLSTSTTYHFQVASADASGNVATSSDYTFTTAAAPDITPPVISNISTSTTQTTATITWTTDENATSTVNYGLTSSYGNASTSVSLVTSHSITLSSLTATTTYHFQVSSADPSNNLSTSSDYTFTTQDVSKNYWVSPTGIATWANCNGDTPLSGTAACSLSTAGSNAQAGDKVYLRGGIYNGQRLVVANSGSSGNLITFESYNGEDVEMTSEFISNRDMESSAWSSLNGASVSKSSTYSWLGSYSTELTTTSSGQGISTGEFDILNSGSGNILYACVYSSQSEIQVTIEKGDGSGYSYNSTVSLYPNKWTCFNTGYFTTTSGSHAYVSFTAPTGTPSGTWYVDEVRLHTYGPLINLIGISYVKFIGINISDADWAMLFANNSSHNEIASSTFTNLDAYSPVVITGNWAQNSDMHNPSQYNWVHNNVFHDNGYVSWSGACYENGDQLRIGATNYNDDSGYNLIEDNTFYHASHDSILLATRYNTVRNNVFHNENWFPDHFIDSGGSTACGGALSNPASYLGARNILLQDPSAGDYSGYNLIENNRVGFAGTPYTSGANNIENATIGNIIRHNYLYKADASGLELKEPSTGISGTDPSYNLIYNNTFFDNGGGQSILSSKQGAIQVNYNSGGSKSPPVGNVVINNIFYSNTATFSGTEPYSQFSASNTVSNNFESNPGFANPDLSDPFSSILPDLSFGSSSGAVDSGTSLTNVAPSDSGSGTQLVVDDSTFFQDGSWAPPGLSDPDWIAVGNVSNIVQISSINYTTNTITLANSITRNANDQVWLYKNSSGTRVLYGSAPDAGAYEYIQSTIIPSINTSLPTSVSTSTLTLNGSITSDGGASSTLRGFAWGTNSSLTGGDTATTTESGTFGTGSFTANLANLTPNTTYYFRAYAVNSQGTSTGSILSTTTLAITAPSAPTSVTATAGNTDASISFSAPSSNGGSTITGYTVTSNPVGGTDTNSGSTALTHTVTGLTNGVSYTFTVTATNAVGTSASSTASNAVTPSTAASVSTNSATSISTSTATLNGQILSTGGSDATESGFAWGTDSSLTGGDTATTTLGSQTGTASFSESLTNLTPNTTYYMRAYAVNANGTTTGSILSLTTDSIPSTYYTLTYTAGSHGSITGSSTQVIISGGNATDVTATADSGYHFTSWSDGSTSNPRHDTSVSSDHTYTASFVLDNVITTVTSVTSSNSSGGGSVSASTLASILAPGTTTTAYLKSIGYTVTPPPITIPTPKPVTYPSNHPTTATPQPEPSNPISNPVVPTTTTTTYTPPSIPETATTTPIQHTSFISYVFNAIASFFRWVVGR